MIIAARRRSHAASRSRRTLAWLAVTAVVSALFVGVAAQPAGADTTTYTVPGTAGFNGVACTTPTTCIAVGVSSDGTQSVIVTVTNGVPGPVETVPGVQGFISIACPTSSLCFATGFASNQALVLLSLVQGGVRQVLTLPSSGNGAPIPALACPTTSSCLLAMQPNMITVTFAPDGSFTTSTGAPMPAGITVVGLACTSATSCIGVGSVIDPGPVLHGILLPFTSGVPGVPVDIAAAWQLDAIACTSSGACLAGGRAPDIFHGVLVPVSLGGAGPVQNTDSFITFGIACPSAAECVESGELAAEESTPSGAFLAQTPLSFEGDHVTCPAVATCLAAGQVHNGGNSFTGALDTLAPAFSANPASVTFAHQRLNTTSAPSTVRVTNSGNLALTFSSVAISATGANPFRIVTNTCTGVLAPGAQCTTTVTFRPVSDKTYNAVLKYTDNAATSPQSISLSGRGCTVLFGSTCL